MAEKLTEVSNGSWHLTEQLEELIQFKQQELVRLQREVLAEQTTLVSTKQQLDLERRQAKQDRQVEADQFRDGLTAEADTLKEERRHLERLDLEIEGRRKDVEQLEAKSQPILDAIQRLQDERIAIEQQRVRNEELRAENDHLANAMGSAHEEVAQLRATLIAEKTRLERQAVEQEAQKATLDQRTADMTTQVENLTALQKVIDPKLAEMQKAQAKAEKDAQQAQTLLAEVTARQAELDKQKSDLATLSSQLAAKASALTDFDAALRRTEAELRIKVQQATVESKVEVSMPDAPVLAVTPKGEGI